eukprot:GHRR01000697.1.p1 GENE.GHRR01000697.1~~GHRR01000697.1.p1  ORF type:complete len:485 (+),score=217.93 GHRR01000697.1:113-1567(+)
MRGLHKHIRPLLASLNSFASGQAYAQYAVPAVAAPKTGGLFGSKRIDVPLSEPLPGVNLPNAHPPKAPELQTGSLAAGVKAAVLDASGPNTCVAVFINGGSSAETSDTVGASKMLEYMAFNATENRTTFRLARELEKYGAASSCIAGREHIAYVVEGTRLQAAEVTEILLDAVLNQKLADWEVNDMLEKMQEDLEIAYSNPTLLVYELLHKAAFSGGLSNSLLPDPAALQGVSAPALREYVAAHFVPGNMAVAAAGMSLTQLQQVAGPLLSGGSAGGSSQPKSSYTGGFLAALAPGAEPTVAVALEAKGGLSDIQATARTAVVKALLGADTRAVLPYQRKGVGGPLTSVTPLVQMYKTTGLIGLLGTTTGDSSSSAAAADVLNNKLQGLTKSVGDAQLSAAKQVALGGYQYAIAAKSGVVQDMGLQLLARGKFSAQEYAAAVSSLSGNDVSKYVGEVLKSPPTVVAVGSITSLPKFDTLAKRLQ